MKKALLILPILALLFACKREYRVEFDISGYCYDTCQGTPLANYSVHHTRRNFSTYTDSTGYFELNGSFRVVSNYGKLPDPGFIAFSDTSYSSLCCDYFKIPESSKFENDTIYGYHTTNSLLSIIIDPKLHTSNQDTLFISLVGFREFDGTRPQEFRSNTATYSINYHKIYAGPFINKAILDTLTTMVAPHVGTAEGSFGLVYDLRGPSVGSKGGRGYYSFVNG